MSAACLSLEGYLLAPQRSQFALDHDTYDEWSMLLATSGAFSFEIDDVAPSASAGVLRGEARFGDVVISPPGSTLRREMRRPTSFFFARFRTALRLPAGRSPVRDFDRLHADLSLLESVQAPSDPGQAGLDAAMVTAHVVSDVLITVLRERAQDRSGQDSLIRSAVTHLLDRFASADLSLGEVAGALGVSPSLLSRRFRAARGVTPSQYLRSVRLRKARELLAATDLTLQTIAERCGYRDAFYLSRVFKAGTGQSPSDYRRAKRDRGSRPDDLPSGVA